MRMNAFWCLRALRSPGHRLSFRFAPHFLETKRNEKGRRRTVAVEEQTGLPCLRTGRAEGGMEQRGNLTGRWTSEGHKPIATRQETGDARQSSLLKVDERQYSGWKRKRINNPDRQGEQTIRVERSVVKAKDGSQNFGEEGIEDEPQDEKTREREHRGIVREMLELVLILQNEKLDHTYQRLTPRRQANRKTSKKQPSSLRDIDWREEYPLIKKGCLWNDNMHLHNCSILFDYIRLYRECQWGLNPMHPACLDEANVRYFCFTAAGADECSPLSLAVSVCLSAGALMAGSVEGSRYFAAKAQQAFDHLVSHRDPARYDHTLVQASGVIAYRVLFFEGNREKALSYVHAGLELSREMDIFNSEAYVLSLIMSCFLASPSADKVLAWHQEMTRVKTLPYYPPTTITPSHFSTPRRTSPSPAKISKRKKQNPESLVSDGQCTNNFDNVPMPLTYNQLRHIRLIYCLMSTISGVASLPSFENPYRQFLPQLLQLRKELKALQVDPVERLPEYIADTLRLMNLGLTAECHFHLDNRKECLEYASSFLTKLLRSRYSKSLTPLITKAFAVGNIFFEMDEMEYLSHLLGFLSTWKKVNLVQGYYTAMTRKLAEYREEQQRMYASRIAAEANDESIVGSPSPDLPH